MQAGNDKIDLARAEQLARERVRAQLASRKRSDNQAADPIVKQVAPLDVVDPTSSSGSDSHDDESPQETPIEQPGQGKKRKHNEVVAPEIENKAESSVVVNSPSTSKSMKEQDKPKKKRSKKNREKKKAKKGND